MNVIKLTGYTLSAVLYSTSLCAVEFSGIEICQIINGIHKNQITIEEVKTRLQNYSVHFQEGYRYSWRIDQDLIVISKLNNKIDSISIPKDSKNPNIQRLYKLSQESMVTTERTEQLLGIAHQQKHFFEVTFKSADTLTLETNDAGLVSDTLTTLDCSLLKK